MNPFDSKQDLLNSSFCAVVFTDPPSAGFVSFHSFQRQSKARRTHPTPQPFDPPPANFMRLFFQHEISMKYDCYYLVCDYPGVGKPLRASSALLLFAFVARVHYNLFVIFSLLLLFCWLFLIKVRLLFSTISHRPPLFIYL